MGKRTEAKKYLLQAVAGFEVLKNAYPDYEEFARFYNIAKGNLDNLK